MSLRDADFREYCFICQERATLVCPRCQRPICAAHAPGRDARCPHCEASFYDEPGRLHDAGKQSQMLGEFTAFLGIPGAATLAALGMTTAAVGVGVGALAIIGALAVRAIRHRRQRVKFLAQGPPAPKQLPAAESQSPETDSA